jgi:hypothetical protein
MAAQEAGGRMNNTELKPCPFCGEEPLRPATRSGDDDIILCSTEGCVLENYLMTAKAWNTRAPQDAAIADQGDSE